MRATIFTHHIVPPGTRSCETKPTFFMMFHRLERLRSRSIQTSGCTLIAVGTYIRWDLALGIHVCVTYV